MVLIDVNNRQVPRPLGGSLSRMCRGHVGKVNARGRLYLTFAASAFPPKRPQLIVKERDEKAACCIEPDMRLEMLMCAVAHSIVTAYGLR